MVAEETAAAVALMLRRLVGFVAAGELSASPSMIRHLELAASVAESAADPSMHSGS